MQGTEALVAITAIIAGCLLLIQVAKYGAHALRSVFGTPTRGADENASLKAGEVEEMIRRAVREEVREEVRPLHENIERLKRERSEEQGPVPRRDLPEDPHDFGLIAEAKSSQGEHAT